MVLCISNYVVMKKKKTGRPRKFKQMQRLIIEMEHSQFQKLKDTVGDGNMSHFVRELLASIGIK